MACLLTIGNTRIAFWAGAALSAALLVLVTIVSNLLDRNPRFQAE